MCAAMNPRMVESVRQAMLRAVSVQWTDSETC